MKNIGILGGTFNPIHNAHLTMAEEVLKQTTLDEVWFMPSKIPPHKLGLAIASEFHRSNMIRLAIKENPAFVFSDFELNRAGITYTSDTLSLLKKTYRDTTFSFIIGGDSLMELETWHNPQEIFLQCRILAYSRPGYTTAEIQNKIHYFQQTYHADILFLQMPELSISSHEIREYISHNSTKNLDQFLPDAVYQYIKNNHLYQTKEEGKSC